MLGVARMPGSSGLSALPLAEIPADNRGCARRPRFPHPTRSPRNLARGRVPRPARGEHARTHWHDERRAARHPSGSVPIHRRNDHISDGYRDDAAIGRERRRARVRDRRVRQPRQRRLECSGARACIGVTGGRRRFASTRILRASARRVDLRPPRCLGLGRSARVRRLSRALPGRYARDPLGAASTPRSG
jgi:hypothetical protein